MGGRRFRGRLLGLCGGELVGGLDEGFDDVVLALEDRDGLDLPADAGLAFCGDQTANVPSGDLRPGSAGDWNSRSYSVGATPVNGSNLVRPPVSGPGSTAMESSNNSGTRDLG